MNVKSVDKMILTMKNMHKYMKMNVKRNKMDAPSEIVIKNCEKRLEKSLEVAKEFNINVIFVKDLKSYETGSGSYGSWIEKNTIYLDVDSADNYTVLHEIGHVFNGYMCCMEHCEFVAHGSAVALARKHNININEEENKRTIIKYFSGYSKNCLRNVYEVEK